MLMYDKILMQDVVNFKRGSDNIYELQNRYKWIGKVIQNRTKDKINILKMPMGTLPMGTDCY